MAEHPSTRLVQTIHGIFQSFQDDLITSQLDEFGAHTRNELAFLLDHVPLEALVVDIGAHIGTYAIPIGKHIGPAGRVLAIEADARSCELLINNVGINGLTHRIMCMNRFLGGGESVTFSRRDVVRNTGAGYYQRSLQGFCPVEAYRCLVLAGFAHPQVVKIDVEGMECSILRSLQPIIDFDRPILYLEVSESHLARYGDNIEVLSSILAPYGYAYYRNVGERNSSNDRYEKIRLNAIRDGGTFFDLLALPQ